MSAVVEARAALQRAEDAERAEHRANIVKQLGQVHAQRVKAEADYLKIAGCVKREREQRSQIRFEMRHVDSLLEENDRHRPATADYLLNKETIAWNRERCKLENARAELLEKLKAVPNSMTVDAIKYEGPMGLIATLMYSERNLLAQLDTESQSKWEGGIFAVSDM